MFKLDQYTALVTGASGGIGHATVHALARQGARLILSGTRTEALEACAEELKSLYPGSSPVCIPCNLADPAAVEQLLPQAEAVAGKVDILVNNAGITRDNLAMRMKDDEWQSVIDINLTAAFRLTRAAVKSMIKRRYGRIINITSVVAVMGNPGQSNYCAAKAGLIGMSKAVAMEVATRGITVNCVAPGFIESAMTDKISEQAKERILGGIPAGCMGSGNDVAHAVAFLAAKETGYITGHTLHVNGGLEMV